MPQKTIDKLIINSPYEEPSKHWHYDRERRLFSLIEGRREAGYVKATESSRSFDDPGIFIPIELVNKIRPRVEAWRKSGYLGVTGITKRLLEHWQDLNERREMRFFFCQLEAIETLIWLTESPDSEKIGIEIPNDGGLFKRYCSKMATGTGKTVVMAMLIAWQVINKVTYPQDLRFSKYVFVVAPGLTVKNRLSVLNPSSVGNYYDEFNIVPIALQEKLRQGQILIHNWHVLNWESDEQIEKRKSVDKRGAKSDEAYVREVLAELSKGRNIIVINDEAHHAWRVPVELKVKKEDKEDAQEATIWINGLDRIHKTRNILSCYDFSATPFVPTGKKSSEESLFDWIVSDFGLNDAIESGLVKTPRVVIRDDGTFTGDYTSRFYHLYMDPEVKDDINRKAEPHEPLPQLVNNAYYLLGADWLETLKVWNDAGQSTPPVMITVANRTETAARIKYAFDHKKILIEELCIPDKTLHIDSKVLKEAEIQTENVTVDAVEDDSDERKLSRKEQAELLRQQVDTVGKVGKTGEQIQNVISVGMLSEGWDAKTVTHIMGLRAFSSQLLCEQVVGRGLRRISYDVNSETGLFDPEYVNIFGVPFTFLPHESKDGPAPPPEKPKTRIEPVIEKQQYEISWPNIIRIEHVYTPTLNLNMEKVKVLEINARDTPRIAELAPIVEGKPDVTKIETIQLEELGERFRYQKIIFEAARDIFDQIQPDWKGRREYLLAQLVNLVEKVVRSDKIVISPEDYERDELKRRILLTLNMNKIVQHLFEAIRFENTLDIQPVFDSNQPIRSTGNMRTWYTSKPCAYTERSHINCCVFDSTWEATEAFVFDRNPNVKAWVKNDHLGFEIHYIFKGVVRKYNPDFILQLNDGKHLIIETKGQDTQQDMTKREFLDEWVRAVNKDGRFGKWEWDVSKRPDDIEGIILKHYK